MANDDIKLGIKITQDGAEQAQRSIAGIGSSVVEMAKSFTLAGVAMAGLTAAMRQLDNLKNYIETSATLAARYQTLGVVMDVVGKNVGYTASQMNDAATAMQKTGISMQESRQQAVALVQAHIDLANASKLARLAQDAAVIANINSSEAFAQLVYGIQSGRVEILRTMGINVNFEQSYVSLAKTLGKTVNQLSENEKTQARMNIVMEHGADIAGSYEASMGTAAKQLLSMQRYSEDLKVRLGEVFNEALTIAVFAWSDALKGANSELDDLSKKDQIQTWGREIVLLLAKMADTARNAAMAIALLGATIGRAGGYMQGLTLSTKDYIAFQQKQTAEYNAYFQKVMDSNDQFERAAISMFSAQDKNAAEVKAAAAKTEQISQQNMVFLTAQLQQHVITEKQYLAAVAAYQKANYGDNHVYTDSGSGGGSKTTTKADPFATMIQSIRAYGNEMAQASVQQGVLTEGEKKTLEIETKWLDVKSKLSTTQKVLLGNELASMLNAEKANLAVKAQEADMEKQLDTAIKLQDAMVKAYDQTVIDAAAAAQEGLNNAVQNYLDLLDQGESHNADLRDEIAAILARNEEIGLSVTALESLNKEREQNIINAREEELANTRSAGGYTGQLEEEIALLKQKSELESVGVNKQAAADAAKKVDEEWKKTTDDISKSLTDALMRGFESGQSFAKNFRDSLVHMFETLVLRPIIQPIAQSAAGLVTGVLGIGASGSAAGAVNGISTASNAYSLLGNLGSNVGTMASYYGGMAGIGAASQGAMLAAQTGEFGLFGVASTAEALGGSMASGFAAAAGPIGLAIGAAMLLSDAFSSKGGPKIGAGTTYNAAGQETFSHGFSGGDPFNSAAISAAMAKTVSNFAELFGTKLADSFSTGVFYNFDPQGDSPGQMGYYLNSAGEAAKTWDVNGQDTSQAAAQLADAAAQGIVAALQTLDLPQSLKDVFAKLPTDNLTASLQQVAQLLDAFGTFGRPVTDLTQGLIDAAGGLTALQSSLATYYQDFYTDQERLTNTTASLSKAFGALGLSMPATKDQFRAIVDSLDVTTTAGQQTFASLMALAPTFAQVADAATAAATAAQQEADQKAQAVAQERASLQDQLLQAQGDTAAIRAAQLAALDESNRGLQENIWALQDQAAAADAAATAQAAAEQKAAAIAQERTGLENTLLQLQGDTTELRRRELAALDASNQALQQQIFDIQDQQAAEQAAAAETQRIADQRTNLEQQWQQAIGDTIGLRQAELAALDASNQALQGRIWALQDANASLDTAYSKLQTAADAQKASLSDAYNTQVQGIQAAAAAQTTAAQANVTAINKVASAVDNALGKVTDTLLPVSLAGRASANAVLRAAVNSGRAGQSLSAFPGLTDALATVQQQTSGLYASEADYRRAQGTTNALLTQLSAITGDQQSVAQMTLDAVKAGADAQLAALATQHADDIAALDQSVTSAKTQLDALHGINDSVLTVADAITAFQAALQQVVGIQAGDSASASVPAFASGGLHAGGARIVGEGGAELELTGPARYLSANQTSGILVAGDDLMSEVRALRAEVARLRSDNSAENQSIASHSAKTANILKRVIPDGDALAVRAAT